MAKKASQEAQPFSSGVLSRRDLIKALAIAAAAAKTVPAKADTAKRRRGKKPWLGHD